MNLLLSMFPEPETNFPLLAVILGLPALGALFNGIFGKRLGPSAVRLMALVSVFGSFAFSLLACAMLWRASDPDQHVRFVWNAWQWLALDTTRVDISFSLDALSAFMTLVVTGIGALIHLYATGYMNGDPGYHRFFAYTNLFIVAMLVLVLGDSLPVLFVGWEGVGLCSYLLIGFWFEDQKNASAGKKAFIANRIGDFGLLVAMAMIAHYVGALSWASIDGGAVQLLTPVQIWPIGGQLPEILSRFNHPVEVSGATLVGLALFLGCAGKSAQIPLYVWLPDAMAGPTPVSALIHAATMVTAGVYLVARMGSVFLLSPTAMMVVAGVGAATALFAATIGLVQHDIKKVLAYSTISQLGYMFMAVGVGAFAAGMFHLFTHAFFKATLFLCAGSVIQAMHARIHDTDASQDMRNMGGLRRYLPKTFWAYLIATLAISGMPLTSGFFSKDEILFRTLVNRVHPSPAVQALHLRLATHHQGAALSQQASNAVVAGLEAPHWFGPALMIVGLLTAVLTALYMFRSLILTFGGEFRGWRVMPTSSEPEHQQSTELSHDQPSQGPAPHEAPSSMTVPVLILAAGALVVGLLNAGSLHLPALADRWLEPALRAGTDLVTTSRTGQALQSLEHMMLAAGVGAFLLGAAAAYWIWVRAHGEPARKLAEAVPRLYRLVLDKWRIDELYEQTVIAATEAFADTAASFDRWVVDGILARVTSAIVTASGSVLRMVQNGKVQMYAAAMVLGLVAVGGFFALPHAELMVRMEPRLSSYVVSAAPGLGYEYRWDSDGDGIWDDGETWSLQQAIEFRGKKAPALGESRKVRVQVRNVFHFTSQAEITLTRPKLDLSAGEPTGMNWQTEPKGVRP